MSRSLALVASIGCAGCSALFGLEDPSRARTDAATDPGDSDVPIDADADPDAMVTIDAAPLPVFVRRIEVVDAKVNSGPHTDFPLLFAGTHTWLRTRANGGDVANGNDIYFSSDQAGVTRLAHEVERYDGATGELVAWIKIPSLQTTSALYVHYGDTAITASQQNRTGVWTGGYALVSHLAATASDSTANASTLGASNVAASTGKFASGAAFNGDTSVIDGGSLVAIDNIFESGGTVEAWIRPTSFGENMRGRVVTKADANGGWVLFLDDVNLNDSITFQFATSGADGFWSAPAGAITLDQWQHVAVVFDTTNISNDATIFINGSAVNELQADPASGSYESDAAAALLIGNNTAGDRTFAGDLDEIRLSTGARTAGWIATQFENHINPGAFVTIGAPL